VLALSPVEKQKRICSLVMRDREASSPKKSTLEVSADGLASPPFIFTQEEKAYKYETGEAVQAGAWPDRKRPVTAEPGL
jgi:hypothetical protein